MERSNGPVSMVLLTPMAENNGAFHVCLGIVGAIFIVTFVITPLVFRLFPSLLKRFIFVPEDEISQNADYKHPEAAGFVGGRNFYLNTKDGATLGVWHTLPVDLENEAKLLNSTYMDPEGVREVYNEWLEDATVFLYLHGSAGSRTSDHRTRMYRLLNQLNYHVITFDYRGYGDSTSFPKGETDLIVDTETVFNWIQEKVVSGKVFVWGHSLGTGVAAHFLDDVVNNNRGKINGVLLEAPFYNMATAVKSSPISEALSFLPWFDYCFIAPLAGSDMAFESSEHLQNITTPIMILHAKDDKIIPYKYAEQLFEEVAKDRKDPSTIQIILYNSTFHYGHYNIGLDPQLNQTVSEFVKKNAH